MKKNNIPLLLIALLTHTTIIQCSKKPTPKTYSFCIISDKKVPHFFREKSFSDLKSGLYNFCGYLEYLVKIHNALASEINKQKQFSTKQELIEYKQPTFITKDNIEEELIKTIHWTGTVETLTSILKKNMLLRKRIN